MPPTSASEPHPIRAPVIGITTGQVTATYGPWKERSALLSADYLRAVTAAGGVPVILTAVAGAAKQLAELIDGLILTGGADVDSALFGSVPHVESGRPDRARDAFEMELLQAASAREIPILAICRGIQIVNVWRGGTLHQHLPDVVGTEEHNAVPGTYGPHRVRIDPASRLGAILGAPAAQVRGHHHQGADQIGQGLVASAWADDGTVEGLEDPAQPYLIAVQWHPEVGEDPSLFESLVAASNSLIVLGRR